MCRNVRRLSSPSTLGIFPLPVPMRCSCPYLTVSHVRVCTRTRRVCALMINNGSREAPTEFRPFRALSAPVPMVGTV